ncbi:MAG TPA: hypothetical protein DCP63_00235 [Bacteroidetes bacterium]|nr:hypothetical protein [Bacteroidota bacterium]
MRTSFTRSAWMGLFAAYILFSSVASSQGQPVAPSADDNLAPLEFTAILKEAWTFLKESTDTLHRTMGSKDEFETTAEFEKRTLDARQQFLSKVNRYIKEKKFDSRVFGVLLKATLEKYNADNQVYAVTSPTIIEAPYNIPSVVTEIPANAYIGLADSIKKAYRTSSLYLTFDPHFRWQVNRDAAKAAKDDAANFAFKVRFKVDMAQTSAGKTARFLIIPQRVFLINQRTNTVHWEQAIR